MSLNKPIGAITEADLHALEDTESRRLDYKVALTLDIDEAKAEFRRDVSSFANAQGGDIIIGIRDKKGVPEEVCGFEPGSLSVEQYQLQLLEILQNRIKPLIRGVAIRAFSLSNSKRVAIIRVPNSFAKPHQVEVGGNKSYEYWLRHDGAKQRMDIDEIRDAILASESFADKARTFRSERVAVVKDVRLHFAVKPGAKTILHLIPLDAFRAGQSYDLTQAEIGRYATNQRDEWPRYFDRGYSFYNFDGLLNSNRNFVEQLELPGNFYIQFFRNGIMEAVESYRLDTKERRIPIHNFQETVIESILKFPAIMQKTGVQPPIAILISLIDVKGFGLQADSFNIPEVFQVIDRDDILIPEVLLTEFTTDKQTVAQLMRPVFDVLWQSCNYRRCPNYADDGAYRSSLSVKEVTDVCT